MVVHAITLIFENIEDKEKSFNEANRPCLEVALIELAKKGIYENGKQLATINYVQNATGLCDYIIQLDAPNIEYLMRAINIIRMIEQIYETHTHVGTILYKNG